MKKRTTTASDNANFTKIADLLEAPYKLRGQRAALKLVVKKAAADRSVPAAAEKLAA